MNSLKMVGRGGRPLRIAYGRVFHEACGWSPLATEPDDFRRMHRMEGETLARAVKANGSELVGYMPHAELTGFAAAAKLAGNVETVPLASSLAVPGGPMTMACFRWLVDDLADRIASAQAAGPLDGIYLALHGSMEVVGMEEAPEAVLLQRLRAVAGPEPRFGISLDLHANLTEGLVDAVDVLVGYRSNPHWDLYPTGFRAGVRLIGRLRDQITPVQAWRKLPMLLGGGLSVSFLKPMRAVFNQLKRLEKREGVISASLFMVHAFNSSATLGWAVHVSTDNDQALADQLVEEFADTLWAQRLNEIPEMLPIDAALDEVAAYQRKRRWLKGPVSLVDADDVVGAGAPGGSTYIVEALARDRRGLTAFVPVHDPALTESLWSTPVGDTVSVTLCGTPGYNQAHVPLTGKVAGRADGDFGKVVRLSCDGLEIAVCAQPPLPVHPNFWRVLGLDPRRADLLVQKNFFHYRMFYAAISFKSIGVKPPAGHAHQGATSLDRLRTRTFDRPMFPQVDLKDWRRGA